VASSSAQISAASQPDEGERKASSSSFVDGFMRIPLWSLRLTMQI
jgi:hypothetical protein